MPNITTDLATVVSLLVALSVASERLVEIVKGMSKFLRQEQPNPAREGWRRAALQALAVVAGIVTAFLARPALPATLEPLTHSTLSVLALGLLASGGSGFWNAVLTYLLQVKNVRKFEAADKALHVRAMRKSLGIPEGV